MTLITCYKQYICYLTLLLLRSLISTQFSRHFIRRGGTNHTKTTLTIQTFPYKILYKNIFPSPSLPAYYCHRHVTPGLMASLVYFANPNCPILHFTFRILYFVQEASRGSGAQSVHVKLNGCGFDTRARRYIRIYLHLYLYLFALETRQSATSSSATERTATEYLNTRFPIYPAVCGIQRDYFFLFCTIIALVNFEECSEKMF